MYLLLTFLILFPAKLHLLKLKPVSKLDYNRQDQMLSSTISFPALWIESRLLLYTVKLIRDNWTNDEVTRGAEDRWNVSKQIVDTGCKNVTSAG